MSESRFPSHCHFDRRALLGLGLALGLVVTAGTLGLLQSPALAAPAEELDAAPVREVPERVIASAAREEILGAGDPSPVLPGWFAEATENAAMPLGTIGECMVDRYNATKPANLPSLNCTANDVRLSAWELISGPTSCMEGEVIDIVVKGEFVAGADERYDVGVFMATDGGNANSQGGECHQDFLNPVSEDNTDLDPIGGFGPFYNGELTEDPTDLCGDIQQNESVLYQLSTVTLVCQDSDSDNVADVSTCTVWANSKSDGSEGKPSCIDESDVTAETTAKCTCGSIRITGLTVSETATIEVVKDLPSGEGLFNLQIDGIDEATDVGDLGSTGPITVSAGTSADPGEDHTVGETAGTGTSLADYDSSIECVDRGTVTFDGGSPLSYVGPGPLTVPVDPDDDIVCTITNIRKTRTLTVVKALVPSGDDGQFVMDANGTTGAEGGDGASASASVDVGATATFGESAGTGTDLADYTTIYSCDEGTSGSGTGGSLEMPDGDVTCTITNTRKTGSIELQKVWEGTEGETTLKIGTMVGGDEVVSKTVTTDDSTGAYSVDTGTYYVSETALADYDSELACHDAGGAVTVGAGGAVEVGDDQAVTCVYTNTRQTGFLEVIKDVDPDDASTSWEIAVTGPTDFNDILSGDDDTGSREVDTGSYTIVETAGSGTDLDDYTTTYECTDDTSGTGTAINVEVGDGESITCTFTNTKHGSIVVEKQTRPDGDLTGFDFNGEIDQFLSDDEAASKEVEPGTYTVSETVPLGWDLTAIVCSDDDSTGSGNTATFKVDPGETVTCVFTNTAQPELALDKRLAGFDRGAFYTKFVTFTIVVGNVGLNPIDVLPLEDIYDPYYLSFADATPYPEQDADDGELRWDDLTQPPPHGFAADLAPGEAFSVTAVFTVAHEIVTTVNTAVASGAIDIYGNVVPDVEDDLILRDTPTAAELLYFRIGDVTGRDVQLAWATAVELDTLGFNLYRAPQRDRSQAELVASVPSRGHGVGGAYTHVDTVPADGVWWYWLGKIGSGGDETLYGPVSSAVGVSEWLDRVYLPLVLRW